METARFGRAASVGSVLEVFDLGWGVSVKEAGAKGTIPQPLAAARKTDRAGRAPHFWRAKRRQSLESTTPLSQG